MVSAQRKTSDGLPAMRLRQLRHAGVQISTQIAEAEESNASNASCLVLLNDHSRNSKRND
jgi:hypothetical protein